MDVGKMVWSDKVNNLWKPSSKNFQPAECSLWLAQYFLNVSSDQKQPDGILKHVSLFVTAVLKEQYLYVINI